MQALRCSRWPLHGAAQVGGDAPWLYLAAIPAGFSERLVRKSVENLEVATTGQR